VLPGWFPHLPDQSQYNRRLRLLLSGTEAELLLGDKGLWGRAYRARLASAGTTLLTPARERTPANERRERAVAASRLVIDSVFANLTGQMRLDRHLAKTPSGLAARIAQRLLALTLGCCSTPSPVVRRGP
jgi:hypothetical protein